MPDNMNPKDNKDVILIVRQDDGNWKGWMQKYGQVIEARQISPGAVLEYLLVHDGKIV